MDKNYVFGLDIGTRTIVGTVGYRNEDGRFFVVAQVSKEHTTRAVIDGQIHDIKMVASIIKEVKETLQEQIGETLSEVCIAAAGRVLKTKRVMIENEFPVEQTVTKEQVSSLEALGVEKAYEEIRNETISEKQNYYCVGYSVLKYFLNGYPMSKIELHKADRIGAELIATFLPEEVVTGLYTAVEQAGLTVGALTLEPLAAIQVAIPEKFRLLNIALVDVGAGTSDISVVKDGSIIAFGMMPLAGDEMTEAIARKYLIDFQQAEKVKMQASRGKSMFIKNIMGEKINVSAEEVLEAAEEVAEMIASRVADKILELNGDKPVSAVFIVGGGGKLGGFAEYIAKRLGLQESRVALRGIEVLKDISFLQKGIKKDSTLVTPIGICLNYYDRQNDFIYVQVNDETLKLYDNKKLTVLDAVIQCGFSKSELFPKRGRDISLTVDREKVTFRGRLGETAEVRLNGEETDLNRNISDQDIITIIPSTKGDDAVVTIRDVKRQIRLPKEYELKLGDKLCMEKDIVFDGMELTKVVVEKKEEPVIEVAETETKATEKVKPEEVKRKPEKVFVFVNGTKVELLPKEKHIFVDILDVYPFDVAKAGGRRLSMKCNGIPVDFTAPIQSGDEIELAWEG